MYFFSVIQESIELDPIHEEFFLSYEACDDMDIDFDEEEFTLEHEQTALDIIRLMVRNGIAAMTYCYI